MPILADEYFQDSVVNFNFTPTQEDRERCDDLLTRVNALVEEFISETGCPEPPLDSGHRVPAKTLALQKSGRPAVAGGQHEQSNAIDLGDGKGRFDAWLDDARLASFDLYREHPDRTVGWSHLQRVAPGSGHRTFWP